MTRKTTTKKPSQLDRAIKRIDKLVFDLEDRLKGHITDLHNKVITETNAIDETVDRIEGKADLLLKGSDFMKEIGEKEEPWMVGDLVTVSPYVSYGPIQGKTMPIRDIDAVQSGFIGMTMPDGSRCSTRAENITRATPAEVQKYEEQVKAQEQEAKKAKLVWGTKVMYGNSEGIFLDHDDNDNTCWVALKPTGNCDWLSISDLTIIDP